MKDHVRHYGCLLFVLMVLAPLCGCLNPEFLNSALGGAYYPTAPGDTPFVMVRVVNETTATLDVPIVWDDGSLPTYSYTVRGLTPDGHDTGTLIQWPVLRIGLGDLDFPNAPLIVANFPDGSSTGVIFGRSALQAGVDYSEGDTIIFQIAADSRSPAYIRVDAGKIDGSSQLQTGLSRADPFGRLWSLLAALGF
ncbi:MAG: hypothetical protein KA354_08185 [Phycisphaerae bacterium]|nr:hypothetical protein [Phycisphaerae bacterium]